MIPIAIITFREFLEAFLIVGIFLGVSKKLQLRKELEIALAAAIGVVFSIALSVATYAFGESARGILSQQSAELLSSYLMFFSGFFLVYIIFSLHNRISRNKKNIISTAKNKLENEVFDFSLFATIIFLVVREGFEIALFTASTSLFSVFFQNIIGLFIGFGVAGIVGTAAFFAYAKFPLKKVFKTTEVMIILLGASMVQVGTTELLEHQFNINIGNIFSFGMHFMPGENSILGNFIRTFTGIDAQFSLPRLLIMVAYGIGIYLIISYKKKSIISK